MRASPPRSLNNRYSIRPYHCQQSRLGRCVRHEQTRASPRLFCGICRGSSVLPEYVSYVGMEANTSVPGKRLTLFASLSTSSLMVRAPSPEWIISSLPDFRMSSETPYRPIPLVGSPVLLIRSREASSIATQSYGTRFRKRGFRSNDRRMPMPPSATVQTNRRPRSDS